MKNKSPLLYIAPDWTLFTQSPLQWNYTYNAWDDTVTYDNEVFLMPTKHEKLKVAISFSNKLLADYSIFKV